MRKVRSTCLTLNSAIPSAAFVSAGLLGLSLTLLLNGCAERSAVQADTREIALTEGEGFHYSPCFSPEGKLIAYSSSPKKGEAAVYVIPTDGGEARKVTSGPGNDNVFAWTEEGNLVVLHRGAGEYKSMEVCWITLEGEVLKSYPSKERAMFEAVSPDGKALLWREFTGASFDLGISDLEGNYELIGKSPTWESDASFGPEDGEVTLIRRDNYQAPLGEIVVWTPETKEYSPLPIPKAKNMNPKWSPDRKYLAYCSDQTGNMDLWVFDRSSGRSIQLTSTPEAERNPDWSPEGDRITFSRRIETSHVFIGDPLTRESRQLTTGAARDLFPAISPDGKWVVFARRPKLTQGEASELVLCVSPVDGEGVQYIQLGDLTLQEGRGSITWSPDSDHIAFTADDGTGNVDIYRVARTGGHPERVTIAPGQDGFPSWSPDGQHLAYMRFAEGATNIWVIPASGGLAVQLTRDGLNQAIAWAPDSDHLAYASVQDEEGEDPELRLTSISNPGDSRVILDKDTGNYPEAWSEDGSMIFVWKYQDETWSSFAFTLDGEPLFKVADEEPGESFITFTEKGKKYVDRIYRGGLHAFTDGDNISNIYIMRVPEIIEAKLQAGGDWK